MAIKDPFYKSSSFWTHLAVSAAGISATLTGMFDPNFVSNHPAVSVALTVGGILATAVSQVAYVLSRAIRPIQIADTVAPAGGIEA